jgi:tRNA pseudouridine55 synthase
MARRGKRRVEEAPGASGFLVVDKPAGWTSHDVVDAARGWFGTRRVGHLGTLDPLATGVLPLAIRAATKLVPYVQDREKGYAGAIRLGLVTDTLDAEGRVLREHDGPWPDEARVEQAIQSFVGDLDQVPPMFSAVKKDGVPLHKLAREGREVEREPKRIHVERFTLRKYDPPRLEIEVECSGGTYVRVLAADLGERLGCGAHLADLRRTRSGPFTLDQASSPETLRVEAESGEIERRLVSPLVALGLPALRVSADEIDRIAQGSEIFADRAPDVPGTRMVAHDDEGQVIGVLELRPGRRLRPLRVLEPFAGRR